MIGNSKLIFRVADTAHNLKFFSKHGAGVKDVFERPAAKKLKKF